MAKKKRTPLGDMEYHAKEIKREIERWKHLNEHGGQDPFWPDGCNMNLVRNHILCAKMKMRNLKEEYGLPLPDEYFAPLPPEVNNDYMANLTQKERVERLRQFGNKLTTKKTDYDSNQMSMI